MAGVNIRAATLADLPLMVELLRQLTKVERAFRFNAEFQRAGLEHLIESNTALVLAAEMGGLVVGMATIQEVISTVEGGPIGIVEDVIVHRSFRKKGVGTALLDHLKAIAIARDYGRLQLLADENNTPGESFYAAQGWEPTSLKQWRWLNQT
ncbi:MAG: N-acetyltransferase family protein [Puniceicoccales bacterium]